MNVTNRGKNGILGVSWLINGTFNVRDIICMSADKTDPALLLVIYNLQSDKITLMGPDAQ